MNPPYFFVFHLETTELEILDVIPHPQHKNWNPEGSHYKSYSSI